ncbi:hypothetical protein FRB93_013697 [Tulasnella sp. JGI-2019a]|nr:hypothetical protein FRB93_013697 [Tulasnella sp. JGI-2019a]
MTEQLQLAAATVPTPSRLSRPMAAPESIPLPLSPTIAAPESIPLPLSPTTAAQESILPPLSPTAAAAALLASLTTPLTEPLTIPLHSPPRRDQILDGELDETEQLWVGRYNFLKERGYLLRPRYRPGWTPSWTTYKEQSLAEDAISIVVSQVPHTQPLF